MEWYEVVFGCGAVVAFFVISSLSIKEARECKKEIGEWSLQPLVLSSMIGASGVVVIALRFHRHIPESVRAMFAIFPGYILVVGATLAGCAIYSVLFLIARNGYE